MNTNPTTKKRRPKAHRNDQPSREPGTAKTLSAKTGGSISPIRPIRGGAFKERLNPKQDSSPRYALSHRAATELEGLLLESPGVADEELLFEAYDSLRFPVAGERDYAHLEDPVFLRLDAFERLELRNAIYVHGYVCDQKALPSLLRKLREIVSASN